MLGEREISHLGIGSWRGCCKGPRCWCTTILMLMEPISSNYARLARSNQEVLLNFNVQQLLTAMSLHQWSNIINSAAFLNSDWSWGLAGFKVGWICAFRDSSLVPLLDQGEGDSPSWRRVTINPVLSPDGPNLISTCMFFLIYPHTEEAACHYHAGKHLLSLDYANGKAHANMKCWTLLKLGVIADGNSG